MSHVVSLGAINKRTGKYVCAKMANKKDEYMCPCCSKDVFPRPGQILIHHYAHKKSDNPCPYYNHPGEPQIHYDAKMLLKMLLENNVPISFISRCIDCNDYETFEIPKVDENSFINIEHRFDFNGPKIADVAFTDSGDIICIFEICNTHKTCNEDRPDDIDWFEIDALSLITMVNENKDEPLKIQCTRNKTCDKCTENALKKEKIRIINEKKQSIIQSITMEEKEMSKIIAWGMTKDEKSIRNRHKRIIKKFNEELKILEEELNALLGIKKQEITKEEKLEELKRQYGVDKRPFCANNSAFQIQEMLINRDIDYTLGNNLVYIQHPIFDTKITRSLVKNKTYYNKKWRENIPMSLIISWYHNTDSDLLDELIC
jgi:hypothetical protein